MMKSLFSKMLRMTERLYLYAHGWEKVKPDYYLPPGDYPFEVRPDKPDGYHRCHAVNAQRQVYAKKTKELRAP